MMLFQKFEENCCNERKYSSVQHFINSRSEELIHDLLLPRAGERLLDVGCGTGDRLIYFRNQGCTVSGIDSSIERVEIAKKRLIHKADITSGSAEDLPFSDNEFDIVTLINTFGFGGDPQKAISEAVRVSRDRVLVVTWNKYALLNSYDRVKYILWNKSNNSTRLFGYMELIRLIRNLLPSVPIVWGSVIFFPLEWYNFTSSIEVHIPTMKNPFGAFLGFSFPVHTYYKTIQDVIRKPLGIKSERRHQLQGVATDMKK